jgi:hypothetical protein
LQYGWHPLAVDAALTNLRFFAKHKNDLLLPVETLNNLFRERLGQ